MWDCLRSLKTTELVVRDHLNGLEREWVIGRLASQGGVRSALYQDDDPHCLIVEYDADLLSPSDLLDLLYSCGLQAEPAPVHRSSVHDTSAPGEAAPALSSHTQVSCSRQDVFGDLG
jgi:hypothetical protein